MNELLETSVQCPYCGETIQVLIDTSVQQQSYIEDCQVCCRPINFAVCLDNEGEATVSVTHEDE